MTYIAIDLGGTRLKMGAYQHEKLIHQSVIPIDSRAPMSQTLSLIKQHIQQWCAPHPKSIKGIAFAMPGIVDRENARVRQINGKHVDAVHTDFVNWAKTHFHCPVLVQNDAVAALQGEWQFGAGQFKANVVMVTLGTGIGTAAIVDGKPLVGAQHFAGNLGGHWLTDQQGATCNCGAQGCAEAQASTWASNMDFKTQWELADKGETAAKDFIKQTLTVWARLIHNLILAYSPSRIIIGGGIAARGQSLLMELTHYLPSNIWYNQEEIEFRVSQLGDMAAILGGIAALEKANHRQASDRLETSV